LNTPKPKARALLGGLALLLGSSLAQAIPMNFSFSGNFSMDDDVQLFNFTADGASTVHLVSYGYAGGTGADGTVAADGGMDTILTVFDAAGAFITSNDDGSAACFSSAMTAAGGGASYGNVSSTGATYDTCLSAVVAAGDYTVAVTQYDNFATGPNLSNGFMQDGQGNFTPSISGCNGTSFCDVTPSQRTSAWNFDVLGVETSSQVVPVPSSVLLLGLGLLALRRQQRS
jgi:PEP-CTERM motif